MTTIEEIVRRIVREEVRAALGEEESPPERSPGQPSGVDPYLTVEEAATYLGVARSTLYNWRSQKTGPAAVKLGRLLRYRRVDLDSWVVRGIRDS